MKVGLFFDTFNPLHNGHIGICKKLFEKKIVDEIWLVISPLSPHKIFDKKIIEYRKLLYGLYEMKRFKIGSEIVKAEIIDISVNGDLVLNINNKQKSFSHGSLSLLTD